MTKRSSNNPNPQSNLRNFDLTVEEIKLQKTIDNMTNMLANIQQLEPNSDRVSVIRNNIRKLNEQLEALRDNTLIR